MRKYSVSIVSVLLVLAITAGTAVASSTSGALKPEPTGTHREGMTKLSKPGHPSTLVDENGYKVVITPTKVFAGVITFLVCEGEGVCVTERRPFNGQGGSFWIGNYVYGRCYYESCRQGFVALYVYDCWDRTDPHTDSEKEHK